MVPWHMYAMAHLEHKLVGCHFQPATRVLSTCIHLKNVQVKNHVKNVQVKNHHTRHIPYTFGT